jgi:hypothetical protein
MNYRQIAIPLLVICTFFLSSCRTESYSKAQQVSILNSFKGHNYYPRIDLDTLNKFDSINHKVGYWLVFLNKYGFITEKPDEAVFYKYHYYNKGRCSYPIFLGYDYASFNKKLKNGKWTLKIADSGNHPRKDTIIALNNTYSYYHRKNLIEEDKYKNGFYNYIKLYYYSNDTLGSCTDFEKKYNNFPLSYLVTQYKKNGTIEESYYIYLNGGKLKGKSIIFNSKPVE